MFVDYPLSTPLNSIRVSSLFVLFSLLIVGGHGAHTSGLSPTGRAAYVLSLPKHPKMGENLMFVGYRCRRQRYRSGRGFVLVLGFSSLSLFLFLFLFLFSSLLAREPVVAASILF